MPPSLCCLSQYVCLSVNRLYSKPTVNHVTQCLKFAVFSRTLLLFIDAFFLPILCSVVSICCATDQPTNQPITLFAMCSRWISAREERSIDDLINYHVDSVEESSHSIDALFIVHQVDQLHPPHPFSLSLPPCGRTPFLFMVAPLHFNLFFVFSTEHWTV